MPYFKKINNKLIRLFSQSGRSSVALSFGVDDAGKDIVIGRQVELDRDSLFSNGSASQYGKGSIVFLTGGTIRIVDADGLWQTVTTTTASQSASPSASGSPSASRSPSASSSLSVSPSGSVSPSASVSPSHSASPST